VVCGNDDGALIGVMVAWDGWGGGHDYTHHCDCGEGGSTDGNNGWFVICSEVVAVPSSSCDADINGDGEVNMDDLLLLIGAWGACP